MNKGSFLREQYVVMISSGDAVAAEWRADVDRFVADMWDRTPTYPSGRSLALIDPAIGFTPDNVEYHFRAAGRTRSQKLAEKRMLSKSSNSSTKARNQAQERAREEQARNARRQRLADDFKRWEELVRTNGNLVF